MVMNLWEWLVHVFSLLFITGYVYYLGGLLWSPKQRQENKDETKKIDQLREVPIKTLEQQFAFLHAKQNPEKDILFFNWRNKETWFKVIIHGTAQLLFYLTLLTATKRYEFVFNWWQFLLLIFVVPWVTNWVLHKFKLSFQNTLHDILRGGKK